MNKLDDKELNNQNNLENKKLLHKFLDSYSKYNIKNDNISSNNNNKNNSIETLINFMQFMN